MNEMLKRNVRSLKGYKVSEYSFDTKLDANENPINIVGEMKTKIFDRIFDNELNRYPDNNVLELKKALANYTGLKIENIICGNGSDQIIKIIIDSFIEAGDAIITHKPTFSMYKVAGEIAGAKVIEIEDDKDFKIQIDDIITKANKFNAKLIFLCNPNNPTGQIINRGDIVRVLENTKSIVVVDEAYYEFYGETMVKDVNNYDKLIVLRTLSKAFGLAGLRVGYGVGRKELIDILDSVKPPYNLNSISQMIACEVLNNIDTVQKYTEYIKNERYYFMKELKKLKGITIVPSFGNYFLMRKLEGIDLVNIFKNKSIAVRSYGEKEVLNNYIRISIGTKEENNRVLDVLKEVTK